MNKLTTKHTQQIKAEAKRLGFSFCGIAKAEFLEEEAPHLEKWLSQKMHGEMHYMEKNFDKRLNPKLLVHGAKSVISLLFNYYPEKQQRADTFKISKYAYGNDYHFVIKYKLKDIVHFIEDNIGEVKTRVFIDSAPVLERAWAKKSGLGWIGKNSMLINQKQGSFFFLAEIILDLELDYDFQTKDHCGTCTICIDACPTNAILQNNVVDGSKCISYFTIELKDKPLPKEVKGRLNDWIFGCDICQDVCPWNRFSLVNQEPKFKSNNKLLNYSKKEWKEITEEIFHEVLKKTAVKRIQFKDFQRNIKFLSNL